jgi:hypothetical protein
MFNQQFIRYLSKSVIGRKYDEATFIPFGHEKSSHSLPLFSGSGANNLLIFSVMGLLSR